MVHRRLLFATACLGMLVFGVVLTTLGALLPSLIERFGMGTADAGALFLLMSLGILVGSLVFGPVVDRYGYRALMLVSLGLVLVGLEGIALAPSLGWLRASVLLIGLGGGVVNGGANALVADVSPGSRSAGLSLLGAFFGVGAVGVPFMLGMLLDRFSYAELIAVAGLVVVPPMLLTAVLAFPAPKQAKGSPVREAGALIRDPFLLLMGLILFLQSGMEITVGGWTAAFFQERMALEGDRALFFLSLYWFGMTLARLAMGPVLLRVAPVTVLHVCIGAALLGSALMITAPGLGLAATGTFLVGAGLAAGFPVVLGEVGDRYAALSGTAFSIALAMALSGGMTLPYLTGVFAQSYGLQGSLLVVPLGLLVQVAVLGLVARRRAAVAAASIPTP